MTSLAPDAETAALVPLSQATRVQRLDSYIYTATFEKTFCIGSVPNGGYVASCMLQAASQHMVSRNQSDTMTAHFEFLSRTEAGSCAMVVEEVKLGRQLSVLHVTLFQNGLLSQAPWIDTALSRKEVTAYVTMTNLGVEKGLSLPTGFSLEPPPPPADLPKLSKDQDALWGRLQFPKHGGFGSMRVLKNVEYYIPKRGQSSKSVIDAWIRLASGEGFTNTSLGYVADCYPYVVESYRPNPPSSGSPKGEGVEPFPFDQAFWYPTVTLNLELKKSVPETGVEWLFMRVQSKQVKKGRLDLEVIIMDEAGELVALSQHVNLIVGGERNLSKRRTKQGQL